MGRVERRMYKRQRRIKIRILLVFLLLIAAALTLRLLSRPGMQTQRLSDPSPTPLTANYDTTIQTRDVTLDAETWYAIQTGVFSTQDAAQQKAAAYTNRGAPGTVVQDGDKWRVFIACYATEEEAAAVRTRLGEMQRVETYLYRWTSPMVRLRLTGMSGQLDVVEAGLSQLIQIARRLRDAAILLDAAQMTPADVLADIAAIDSQLTLWQETARARFQQPYPPLLKSLLTVAEGWGNRSKALRQAAASATTLSAELKAQGMSLFDETARLRSGISTTP